MNHPWLRWLLDVESIPGDAQGVHLSWEHPLPGWVWMLLVLAAALFAFWSYTRLTGRRTGRAVLAAARFALLMLVVILLAGPMLVHPRETVEEDWVLVLVDRSRSMEIADAPSGDSRTTRDAQVRDLIAGHGAMWRQMDQQRHVVWLGFHGGAFALPQDPVGAVDGPAILPEPRGERTSLNTALSQALQLAAARPVAGVAVLSDGRTIDPPSRALLRRLQAQAIPVYAVPLGSPDPIGDVAVRRVEAPRRAFVRDKVPVVVELDRLGAADRSGDLSVSLVDTLTGELLDRIDVPVGDGRDRVTLTAEPTLAGETTWQVVVETARPDLIPENNLKPFAIELIDRPLRILYVEGYPRWEYRYLKNLIVREKSIDSSVMLLSADRDFAQEGNQPITRLPRSPEEFAQFDVIIIGDVPGTFFSSDQLEVMRDQVAQRGTGLLWVGGEQNTPATYVGTVLSDLLPMRGPLALSPIGEAVTMQPTDLAERLGVLRLALQGQAGGQVGWPAELIDPAFGWSQLHYAQRIEPGRLKPTAEPLAQTTALYDGEPLPLVIHMRFGAGQTIYVATDEIWRWRYGRGELLPEQFWVQMIRMLGRESLFSTGQQASLEVRPRRVEVNRPVRVELRLLDATLIEGRRPSVAAVVETAAGEPVTELELMQVAGGNDRFAATYLPRVTGLLRVRLDDPTLAGLSLEGTVEVFAPDDELRRPETDHPLLEDLATATGGRSLDPGDIDQLAGLLPNRSVRTLNPLTERIWDTPFFFGLVLLTITGEWVGRKVMKLV